MDTKKDNFIQYRKLGSDNKYYNHVFKKTEKITAAVFYILSYTDRSESNETHIKVIEKRTHQLHDQVLATLETTTQQARRELAALRQSLVALLSTMHVASAARIIPSDVEQVLESEIDTVLRQLEHYAPEMVVNDGLALGVATEESTDAGKGRQHKQQRNSQTKNDRALHRDHGGASATDQVPRQTTQNATSDTAVDSMQSTTSVATPRRTKRSNIPAGDYSSDAVLVYSDLSDRTERIRTVLEAKPQATIKDIAQVITDVSEKTIQRDLKDLIEKGQVIREGQRRWSRYSVL